MARLRGTLMIGGLVAALVLAPAARAAGGQITFSGMIVEPTCAIGPDAMASLLSRAQNVVASGGRCAPALASAQAGSRYDLAVSTLAVGQQADQLLSYFAGNAQAAGATARLVTQTYE